MSIFRGQNWSFKRYNRDNKIWVIVKGHWTIHIIKDNLCFFFPPNYISIWPQVLVDFPWQSIRLLFRYYKGHRGFLNHQRNMSISRANRIYHRQTMSQDLQTKMLTGVLKWGARKIRWIIPRFYPKPQRQMRLY